MTSLLRTRAVAGTFVALVGLGTLAACGDGGGGATVSTKDAKVKVDDDKVTVETSEGTASVGRGLPDGFPEDAIPLADEKVVNGVKGTDGGPFAWSVVMTSERAVGDLSGEITKDFAGAGYKSDQSSELGDVSVHQFSNGTYEVGVTVARTGDGVTITYLVKNKA